MKIHMPHESSEYRAARDKLLEEEIALRRHMEKVAQMRRDLPLGGEVDDYVFETAKGKETLAELFGDKSTLAIYSYMFGPEKQTPCPMCTPMIETFAAIHRHVEQRTAFVVLVESPIARILEFAKVHNWGDLRFASAAGNTFNKDYYGKGDGGFDTTMMNVFKNVNGKIHHFWGTELTQAAWDPGQNHRGLDFTNPVFNLLDVTPEGRGNFLTKLEY